MDYLQELANNVTFTPKYIAEIKEAIEFIAYDSFRDHFIGNDYRQEEKRETFEADVIELTEQVHKNAFYNLDGEVIQFKDKAVSKELVKQLLWTYVDEFKNGDYTEEWNEDYTE